MPWHFGHTADVGEFQKGERAGNSGPSARELGQSRKITMEKGKEREKSSAGLVPAWDIEPRYIGTSSSDDEDEEHATCVPTKWKTGGVNTAYESLL